MTIIKQRKKHNSQKKTLNIYKFLCSTKSIKSKPQAEKTLHITYLTKDYIQINFLQLDINNPMFKIGRRPANQICNKCGLLLSE